MTKTTMTAAITATWLDASSARNGRPISSVAPASRGARAILAAARVRRSCASTTRAGLMTTSSPQVDGASPQAETASTGRTVSKPQAATLRKHDGGRADADEQSPGRRREPVGGDREHREDGFEAAVVDPGQEAREQEQRERAVAENGLHRPAVARLGDHDARRRQERDRKRRADQAERGDRDEERRPARDEDEQRGERWPHQRPEVARDANRRVGLRPPLHGL